MNYILLIPTVFLLVSIGILILRKYRDNKKWDIPFRDDHERAPGESLRLKIEILDEQVMESGFWLMIAGVMPIVLFTLPLPLPSLLVIPVLLIGVQIWFGRRLWMLIPELRSYRIGFEGERLTAQYLQPLLCQGYHVFHDIPMGEYNVDHVVVGPNGVFAIETKARRKRHCAGQDRAKVGYDGKTLQYPMQKPETWGLDAAKDRAKGLQQWLSSAVGEAVNVQPILSLPGWYIERTEQRGLPVMNPKSIPNFVAKYGNPPLNDVQVKRIRHILGERGKARLTDA